MYTPKKKSSTEDIANEESYKMLQNYCSTLLKIKQDVTTSIASEYAYLPNIRSISDEKVQVHWTKDWAVLPEYRKAKAMFCLESEWLSDTMLLRQIRDANARFGEELKNMNSNKAFEKACLEAICKGYKLKSKNKAKKQKDLLSQRVILNEVRKCYNNLEAWKKPYFNHALHILSKYESDNGAITTKLAEVCDRALHCRQVQVKSFNLLMSHSYRLILSLRSQVGLEEQVGKVMEEKNGEEEENHNVVPDLPATYEDLKVGAHVICSWDNAMDKWENSPDGKMLDVGAVRKGKLYSAQVKGKTNNNKASRPIQISFQDGNTKWVPADLLVIIQNFSNSSQQNVMAVKCTEKWSYKSGPTIECTVWERTNRTKVEIEAIMDVQKKKRAHHKDIDKLTLHIDDGASVVKRLPSIKRSYSSGEDLESYTNALQRFYEIMEDYIDDHKENAFQSSFVEPSEFYFHFKNRREGWNEDNVVTHSINYYLTLLNSTVGVHLPMLPAYWENWPETVCDFWAGLSDEAWEQFSAINHFGISYEGISELKNHAKKYIKNGNIPRAQFPKGSRPPPAKEFANNNVNPNGNANHRKALALYIERFASFFKLNFFVYKAFNKLYSEEKPEHAGFRRACATLYNVYRNEQSPDYEEEFIEYCFKDEMFMELDIERVARFFVWLGVVKPTEKIFVTKRDVNRKSNKKNSDNKSNNNHTNISKNNRKEKKGLEEVEKVLLGIEKQLQKAMKDRDTNAIRALMAKRNEVQTMRSARLKKNSEISRADNNNNNDDAKALGDNNKVFEKKLLDINKKMQKAMADRDTNKIRSLMAERSKMLLEQDASKVPPKQVVVYNKIVKTAKESLDGKENLGFSSSLRYEFGDVELELEHRCVYIDGSQGAIKVTTNSTDKATVTCKLNIDTFIQVIMGELKLEQALGSGKMKMEGNTSVLGAAANLLELLDSGMKKLFLEMNNNDSNSDNSNYKSIKGGINTGKNNVSFYVDDKTDGGGWVLLFCYNHKAHTNPELVGNKLPLDPKNGFSHAHVKDIVQRTGVELTLDSIQDVRFYGKTSGHGRIIHFRTSKREVKDMAFSGEKKYGDPGIWNTGFTKLSGHSANIPGGVNSCGMHIPPNPALAAFPFYIGGRHHWGIRGCGYRWEVDDVDPKEVGRSPTANPCDTLHQVWVRFKPGVLKTLI